MKISANHIAQLFCILAIIGLVLWLVNSNVPRSGYLTINLIAGKDQPTLSKLGPELRVKIESDYQAVLESPVYFDLRLMPWFSQIRIEMVYREQGQHLLGIGGQQGGDWNYDVHAPFAVQDQGDGWQQAVFDFNLDSVKAVKNVRRFLISTDGTSTASRGELDIQSLKIIASR